MISAGVIPFDVRYLIAPDPKTIDGTPETFPSNLGSIEADSEIIARTSDLIIFSASMSNNYLREIRLPGGRMIEDAINVWFKLFMWMLINPIGRAFFFISDVALLVACTSLTWKWRDER